MQCSKCRNEGIVFQPYSGQHLCREHFLADVEAKAKRAIRVHQWIQPGDHIAVGLNGDPGGEALLFFFRKLTKNRRDIRISEIQYTGGIPAMMADAHASGVTKIACAVSLEDAAAAVMVDLLRGNAGRCFLQKLSQTGTIPMITPFHHVPAEEIALYARIHGLNVGGAPFSRADDSLFTDVKAMLSDYTCRHPAAPYAILNLFESLAEIDRRADREGLCGT